MGLAAAVLHVKREEDGRVDDDDERETKRLKSSSEFEQLPANLKALITEDIARGAERGAVASQRAACDERLMALLDDDDDDDERQRRRRAAQPGALPSPDCVTVAVPAPLLCLELRSHA